MPDTIRPPESLRRAVAADLRPVRPLAPPARRALAVAAWAPIAAALVLAALGLRPDQSALGWPGLVMPVLVEVAVGLALIALALAESVPARGAALTTALSMLGLATLAFVGQAAWTRGASAGVAVPHPLTSHGPSCFALQVAVGVPALALVAVLVARAAPLRAAWAGMLGGAGAGFLAEGVYHLHCPITELRHVLVWHAAAVLALALLGLAGGRAWERAQRIRISAQPASRRSAS